MLQTRFACVVALLLAPVLCFSASPLPLSSLPVYASATLDRQSIGISDSRFTMPVVTFTGGLWSRPGIGFELELGKSLSDDSLNNLDLEVHSFSSLNLRLESPPINRVAAYALFGLSRTNIDSGFSGDVVNQKKNSFRGFRGALGLTFMVGRQLVVDTAFTHHEYDDDIGINSFRLGLRFDFSAGGR